MPTDRSHLSLTEDVGVTESLSNFIAMYSDHKEQQEYTRWLQNVQKFTS